MDGVHGSVARGEGAASIEQAKGMLMVVRGISADRTGRAFEVLVQQSRTRSNRVSAVVPEFTETLTKR